MICMLLIGGRKHKTLTLQYEEKESNPNHHFKRLTTGELDDEVRGLMSAFAPLFCFLSLF